MDRRRPDNLGKGVAPPAGGGPASPPASGRWEELLAIMDRLRSPGGCPWDREQTPQSLKKYIVEEAHEVLEAIDKGDPGALADELGDLLLQIVFQARIGAESGAFTIDDVLEAIIAKLVRRHPHVFGEASVEGASDVLRNWEEIKRREKGRRDPFAGVPGSLPALRKAARVQGRAAAVGFDWPDISGVLDKLREEVAELEGALAHGDRERVVHELGDLLFAAVNLSRHAGVEAEEALGSAVERFRRRFAHVERRLAESGRTPRDSSLEEMDLLWNEAKDLEKD